MATMFSPRSFTSDTTYLHVPQRPTQGWAKNVEAYVPTKRHSPRTSMLYNQAHRQSPKESNFASQGPYAQQDNLVDLLHKLRHELAQHRHLMLNIQSRLSSLEQKSRENDDKEARRDAEALKKSYRDIPIRPESQVAMKWWTLCQNFAQNSDTPINVDQFMGRTRASYSAFDFEFDMRRSKMSTVSFTPTIDDVPELSDTSQDGQESDSGSPEYHQVAYNHTRSRRRSATEIVSHSGHDIVNQVVDRNKSQPPPPLLQSPPQDRKSGSSRASHYNDVLTALPSIPPSIVEPEPEPRPPHRLRTIKSKFGLRTVFKKGTQVR